jgi:hypothetical protein
MKKELPIFEFIIDDTLETGVKAISIVTDPAFESAAVYFQKAAKFIAFKDAKKQIVAGLSLIPNVPVYRVDPETGMEYYGIFRENTIERIVDRYHSEMLGNKVNVDHNDDAFIDAYLVEDFIVNSEQRKADLNSKGIDHKNIIGSWYTAFKIKDPEVFNAIENSGNATGFSIECYMDKILTKMNEEVKNKLIASNVKSEMNKINKTLKEKILSIFTEFEDFKRILVPELGFEIDYGKAGQPVNKVNVDPNGNETLTPIGQGEFSTDAGIVVVDDKSNLVEVRPLPKEPKAPTGDTSGNTSTVSGATTVVNDMHPNGMMPSGYTTTGNTDMKFPTGSTTGTTVTHHTSGDTSGSTSGGTQGIHKTVAELVGTQDGHYIIAVIVQGGIVTEAKATSEADLLKASNEKIKDLEDKNKVLDEKVKAPIADPILSPEVQPPDFSKMSAYEREMYNRGQKPVNVKK